MYRIISFEDLKRTPSPILVLSTHWCLLVYLIGQLKTHTHTLIIDIFKTVYAAIHGGMHYPFVYSIFIRFSIK